MWLRNRNKREPRDIIALLYYYNSTVDQIFEIDYNI